jgi:hypothetical protein
MDEYEAGVTAPPFHPRCRTTTAPYFDDEVDATRAARDPETGKTVQVPADMKYQDWKDQYTIDPETGKTNAQLKAEQKAREEAEAKARAEAEAKAAAERKAAEEAARAKTKATNRFGEEIVFHEKHTEQTREIITTLSNEYESRLKTVGFGAEKAAGSVDISSTTIKLSSKKPVTIIHEFAHTISNPMGTKYGLFEEKDKAFWKEMRKLQLKYLREVGQDSRRWISSYEHGSGEVQEFFAEAFAQVKMKEMGFDLPQDFGSDFTYSNEAMKILEKYFKRKK